VSILFSGDFHNNLSGEINFITKKYLIDRYSVKLYKDIKYHIILGDGGFLQPGSYAEDVRNFKVLSERPFPILCVLGNRDPVLGRIDLPEIDIGIGEEVIIVNKAKPLIAYLKRGRIYNIENKRFLALGGALSIDKHDRQPGMNWWEQEYWTE
jgi:hypothetical protein